MTNLEDYKKSIHYAFGNRHQWYLEYLRAGFCVTDENYCKKAQGILSEICRKHQITSITLDPDLAFIPPCIVNGYEFTLEKNILSIKETNKPGNLENAIDKVTENIYLSSLPINLEIKHAI